MSPTLRRFAVYGPVHQPFSVVGEPPDPYRDYVEVEAATRRDARIAACKTREMVEHVVEMRGDHRPPWHGLTVEEVPRG